MNYRDKVNARRRDILSMCDLFVCGKKGLSWLRTRLRTESETKQAMKMIASLTRKQNYPPKLNR